MHDSGSVVAGHALVEPIGSGPFGRVFRAEGSKGRAAVKLLKPGFLSRPDGRAAFERLAASVAVHAQLRHPYLARVLEPLEDAETSAYGQVSELLDGVPLSRADVDVAAIKGEDPLALASVLTWYEQLGDVLTWLHAQSMVHGNLKPTNVMIIPLAGEHHVKLLDVSWSSIGVAAVPAGPNSYVAPEQYRGSIPTPLSDQWALGSMLERTFTRGRHRLALGVLPAALVQAVQRSTREEPAARFPALAEFVDAIREIRIDLQRAGGADVAPQHDAKTLPAGSVPSDLAAGGQGHGISVPGPTTDLDAAPEPVVFDPAAEAGPDPVPGYPPRGASTPTFRSMPSVNVDGRATLSDDAEIPSSRITDDTADGAGPLRRHDISGLLEEESGLVAELPSAPSTRSPAPSPRRNFSIPPPASTVRGYAPAPAPIPNPTVSPVPPAPVASAAPVRASALVPAPAAASPTPIPVPVIPPAPPFSAGPRAATLIAVIASVAAGAATIATFPIVEAGFGGGIASGGVRTATSASRAPPTEAGGPVPKSDPELALAPTGGAEPAVPSVPSPEGPQGDPSPESEAPPLPSSEAPSVPETLETPEAPPTSDLDARCAAGSIRSCVAGAKAHAAAGEWTRAARAFEKACAPNRSWSCYRAARIFSRQSGQGARATALFAAACEGGRRPACVILVSRTSGDERSKWAERACALGDAKSCPDVEEVEDGGATTTSTQSAS